MEWILSFVLVVFLIGTGVLCQDCLPIVEGSSFWVEEGNPFVVNCSLSNCQSRTVGTQWWMNGERVYRKDFTKRIYETKYIRRSKLVINPVKPEDAGTFTCINDVDSSKNVSIKLNVGVVQRMGAHKHVMEITPSRFEWTRFKNELHFYVMLGAVPLSLLTLFVNLFIGKAELTDIPEGYEPKEWEYSSSPITQFIHRMWFEPMQKSYEKKMHALYLENEKRKQLKLEARVTDMMRQNQDYMGWYYIPVHKSMIDRGREYRENVTKDLGRS